MQAFVNRSNMRHINNQLFKDLINPIPEVNDVIIIKIL